MNAFAKAAARVLGAAVLLLCLSAVSLQAQRGRSWVNGLVHDESETHGVQGATVSLTALHVKLKKDPQDKTEGGPSMTGDLSRIDHVILGINDLQRGIEELERLTGVRAVFGGAHPGRGTQNALISLGGAHYLEILAPNPEDKGSAEAIGELGKLTALTPIGWAAKSGDLPALRQSLQSQGVQTEEVRPGARNRPDGTRLAWKTLGFTKPSNPLLPFFIEWDPAGAHPSTTSPGGCRLTGFTLEDPAPDTLRKPLQAAGVQVAVREGKESRVLISLACPKGNVELR